VSPNVRLLVLLGCGALVEAGWLAMWPLSGALSHSAPFTTAVLQLHPLVSRVFELTVRGAQYVLPGLGDSTLTDPLGSSAYFVPAAALGAVMLWLAAAYALTLMLLDRWLGGRRSAAFIIIGGAIVFQFTLLVLPGLFSQDVFSYIAYGRIAAIYDLNPYIWPPSVLRDPVVPWVAEVWRTYATPYGPAWVGVQWLIAHLSSELSIADQALVYRAFANILLLVNLGLAWLLAGRMMPLTRTQRTTALAALAWNPLVLFEIAGNAHNDALMVSCVLLGLLLFRDSSRGILASAALALGTLVKYLSGLGFVWLALASAARATGWLQRAGRVLVLGLTAVAFAVLLSLPWLELPDSLNPLLNETAGVGYVNSLPDIYAMMLVARLGLSVDVGRGIERLLVLMGFAVYLAWEARRVWREPNRMGVGQALARSVLVYVLLVSTSVQTWYLCLPVAVAATLGWHRPLTRLTLAYSALALPALYLSYYLRENTPGWVFLVYGLGPLLVFLPSLARLRQRRERPNPVTMAHGRIPSL
jgi:hypothetical protein